MMQLRSLLIAVGVVSFAATALPAQTCVGAAAYSAGPIGVGGAYSTRADVKSYGLTLGVGAKTGPFAQANLARAEYPDFDRTGTIVGVSAGYAIDLIPTHKLQFCPLVRLSHQSGPDIDFGTSTIDISFRDVGVGGSFGGVVPVTTTLELVPFAGASFFSERFSATYPGNNQSDSANSGLADVGAGFVINKTLTIQPSVSIPFGFEGARGAFHLAFALNFGGSPKH